MSSALQQYAMPGPHDIARVVLDNGIIVLVRENHAAPVAVVEGALPAGAVDTTADQAGLASLTAKLLMRGSKSYDFSSFNEQIESVGASLSVSAGDHTTDFGLTCLSEDFATMVDLMADTLRRPTFPDEHIERVRTQTLVGIQERDQDTQQVASLRFYETLYGDHPYGRSNDGYVETIRGLNREDISEFHTSRYTPHDTVIVVTGDVDTDKVISLIQHSFGDWTGPSNLDNFPLPDTACRAQVQRFVLPDKIQSDVVMGCHAVSRHHPDFYAIRVANTILGRFGMMGRLGEKVREEQGLAYYAYSEYDASPHAGVWLATAGVNPFHVEQASSSILDEFVRLGSERVSDEELDDSQAFLTGVVPLTLETNEGVANTLLQMELHDLGMDYLMRYKDIVYGITADDVQRVAKTYLRPETVLTVVAGPEMEE